MQTPFTPETVYTFKLTNGEEIVARVVMCYDTQIEISDPMSVVASNNGIGMVATMFTAGPHTRPKLNTNNVMIWAETEENVRLKYIETTTGLALPGKKMILG